MQYGSKVKLFNNVVFTNNITVKQAMAIADNFSKFCGFNEKQSVLNYSVKPRRKHLLPARYALFKFLLVF